MSFSSNTVMNVRHIQSKHLPKFVNLVTLFTKMQGPLGIRRVRKAAQFRQAFSSYEGNSQRSSPSLRYPKAYPACIN